MADLRSRQPENMPEPDLDRIRAVVDLLDHPELTYPTIHVTGTNGKTTTARLVTALTCAHGLTTGTFVSPHLESEVERLSVCGDPIGPEEFAEEHGRIAPVLERVDGLSRAVTYFEALTAMAYLWFADKPVSLGVFEVGMGGTWDATNLVSGDVAVICPISLDHTQVLGDTVAAIAGEKAGIVKEGRTAVVREQPQEAMEVIRARAADVGATLVVEGEGFALRTRERGVGGQLLEVDGIHGAYDELFLPLFGEQAARNAGAAVAATEAFFGRALDPDAVRQGLAGVTSPGRLEVVARQPAVVLDGAHNVEAARALVATLRESFAWRRLHLVVGVLSDKDVRAVVGEVAAVADVAYACASGSPRATPPARVAAALQEAGVPTVSSFETVAEAVAAAVTSADVDDLVVVTGSLYTVGEARPVLRGG